MFDGTVALKGHTFFPLFFLHLRLSCDLLLPCDLAATQLRRATYFRLNCYLAATFLFSHVVVLGNPVFRNFYCDAFSLMYSYEDFKLFYIYFVVSRKKCMIVILNTSKKYSLV